MTTELTILGWAIVLAVVQILIPVPLRSQETGFNYALGPRDETAPPDGKLTGRLKRAQGNMMETLPLFAAAILVAHVAGREGALTLWGAWLYLACRIVYLPLYALGVPVVRTLAWAGGLTGLVLVLIAVLKPA